MSDPSDKIVLTGYTTVEGVTVAVTLTVDTVALIHKLGRKAAKSSGRKSVEAGGNVFATVNAADWEKVNAARYERHMREDVAKRAKEAQS